MVRRHRPQPVRNSLFRREGGPSHGRSRDPGAQPLQHPDGRPGRAAGLQGNVRRCDYLPGIKGRWHRQGALRL